MGFVSEDNFMNLQVGSTVIVETIHSEMGTELMRRKKLTGRVVGVRDSGFGVQFDDYINGHRSSSFANGNGKAGYCWNIFRQEMFGFVINKITNNEKGW